MVGVLNLNVRDYVFNNFYVVKTLKFIVYEKNLDSNFFKRKCKLLALIVGINIDQNDIGNSSCKLNNNPLGFIIGIKSHSVFRF